MATKPLPATEPWTLTAARMARRGSVPATLTVAAITGVAWGLGWLPAETRPAILAAVGLAVFGGVLGIGAKCLLISRPSAAGRSAMTLQLALFGDFVLQLILLALGVGSLFVLGLKFPAVAGFAIAYAAVVMVFQVVATFVVSREMDRSAKARAAAATASSLQEPTTP